MISRPACIPLCVSILICAAPLPAASAEAQQPSFDCAKAGIAVEHAICGSATLAGLDRQLADIFAARRGQLGGSDRDQLVAEQRNWLNHRKDCGADANCLAAAMKSRIAALSGITTAPAAAPTPASYLGRWQRYGRTETFSSAMTLTPSRLSYDDGLAFDLKQVRPRSNVYRVLRVYGEDPAPCGNQSATHMAFTLLEVLLQLHEFSGRTDPADPPPMTVATLGSGLLGDCSVSSYAR